MLKKSKKSNDVLFIDASDQFVHSGNKNRLSSNNRQHILKWYTQRKGIKHRAKLVPNSQIGEDGYNISISTYIQQERTDEDIDIRALNQQITDIVEQEQDLRRQIGNLITQLADLW